MNTGTATHETKHGCTQSGEHRTNEKWAAVVDDVLVPMPRRKILASVLAAQASVPAGFALVRDHNSPDDVVIPGEGIIDLAEGNVFYRLERCEVTPRGECRGIAKLAFVLDDRFEVTTRSDQTGRALRELFGISLHSRVYRDVENPTDEEAPVDAVVRFEEGPVFYSREVKATLTITVNSRVFTEHTGVKPEMAGLAVAALVYPENPSNTRIYFVSERNREIGLTEKLKIRGCEVFDVVRKEVTGGFERSRVDRELEELRAGGLSVSVADPPGVVVFHELGTGTGAPIAMTDVLVPIPGGYPGQMIDWAYLPEGSPLIGRVKGSPQNIRLTAFGQVWRQISYHPHKGGGGPKWNPTAHGFHTYLGEVISWLRSI